jgi:hypothetical protein
MIVPPATHTHLDRSCCVNAGTYAYLSQGSDFACDESETRDLCTPLFWLL